LKHTDNNETYQNLSQFLVNNYKQALDILKGEVAFCEQMHNQVVADTSVFVGLLADERAYLVGLKREPLQETWQIEYWQKLITLDASQ
ncbi:hypothetical protein BYT27DRAFT_7081332, partial [Phlegmacium glaucopus]